METKSNFAVRLTPEQRIQLESVSANTGIALSDLIRASIGALIKHYEANGNRLMLPLRFDELIHSLKTKPAQGESHSDITRMNEDPAEYRVSSSKQPQKRA